MIREEVFELLTALEHGHRRAAVPAEDGTWKVDTAVKEGILFAFRLGVEVESDAGPFWFRDRDTVPPRRDLPAGVRIVPGGSMVRRGSYMGKGVVMMPPSYVNVGAYVDDGTMIDSHVLVGSCAQIGKRVHLSAAARFWTPLFLYDFDALEERVVALQTATGPRFRLAYAVKANPSLAVLKFLEGRGLWADVASAGELAAAQRAGFTSERLVSTGPSKSDRDLEKLVAARIRQIHVEGPDELIVLNEPGPLGGVMFGLPLNTGAHESAPCVSENEPASRASLPPGTRHGVGWRRSP